MYQMAQLVSYVFQAIYLLMFVRVALSWFPHDRYHPVISFVYQATDPILEPFRQLIPSSMGIDFSPIVAFFALNFAERIIIQLLL